MTGFWWNWMKIWCVGVAVFGLVLMGGGMESTAGPSVMLLDLLNGPAPIELTPPLRFTLAVLGAVTLGWSITFFAAFLAANRLGAGAAPVWRLITLSVVTWYVVDSALSVLTGFALNVVSNTGLVVAYFIPVLATGVMKE